MPVSQSRIQRFHDFVANAFCGDFAALSMSQNRNSTGSAISGLTEEMDSPGDKRCLTLEDVRKYHEFKETNRYSGTKDRRRVRKQCPACSDKDARTHYECKNPVCMKKIGANDSKGVFYCENHFHVHHQDIFDQVEKS